MSYKYIESFIFILQLQPKANTGIGGVSIATEHSKSITCTTDFWGPIQIKGEQAPPTILA